MIVYTATLALGLSGDLHETTINLASMQDFMRETLPDWSPQEVGELRGMVMLLAYLGNKGTAGVDVGAQAISRPRLQGHEFLDIAVVNGSKIKSDDPCSWSKVVPADSDEIPGTGVNGAHYDRMGRLNVTSETSKGVQVFQPLDFKKIKQFFFNSSSRHSGTDPFVPNANQAGDMSALYAALAGFEMECMFKQLHSTKTYLREMVNYLCAMFRFRVPPYENRKGEFSPTLDRRDATVKAHAKRMNRLLAAKRSDVGVADCPVIPRDEVTASIRHPL